MKKIIDQYGTYFEPLIIIAALIIVMLGQSQVNLFFYWITSSLLLGVVLWRLRKPDLYYPLIKDKAFLFYSLFFLWGLVSTIYWSAVKVNSFVTVVTFLVGLLSYFIGYTDNSKQSFNVQRVLLLLGLGLVIYTYYQYFILGLSRPMGLLLNWNTHAAMLAMIVLPWILRYALKIRLTNTQLIYICTVTLLFAFALGLTQSRGALLILATGAFGLLVMIRRQRLSYKQSMFFLLAIVLGYILSSFFVNQTILQRIGAIAELQTYATTVPTGRHLLWLPAWHMYLDRPFLGWGLGTYTVLFAQYKAPLTDERGHYAHNDYLQFLLELGPVGLLLFMVFVFFVLQKLYYVLQKNEDVLSKYKIEAFTLLIPCVGMLVHTFFTFHLYHLSMQMIFGYYLGRAAKCVQIEQGGGLDSPASSDLVANKKFTWRYRTVCFVMVIVVIISGFSSYQKFKGKQATTYPDKIDHYLKAGLFFTALDRYEAISARHFAMQLQKMPVNEETLEQRQQVANHALNLANSAIEKVPLGVWNYITKAEVLRSMQGNNKEVAEQYVQALTINPYLLDVRLHYARFLEENGHNKQALDLLWAGWGLINKGSYQKAIDYLQFQLEINNQYGSSEDSLIIEQLLLNLKRRGEDKSVKKYVFYKSN